MSIVEEQLGRHSAVVSRGSHTFQQVVFVWSVQFSGRINMAQLLHARQMEYPSCFLIVGFGRVVEPTVTLHKRHAGV